VIKTTLKINPWPFSNRLSREMVRLTDDEKEKAIRRFLAKFPNYDDERIAYIYNYDCKRIAELRLENDTKNRKAEMSSVPA